MMMHNHNLWYILLTYLSCCKWPSPDKSPRDILMRGPAQYFATVFNRLTSTNLPKTLNLYTIEAVTFHTGDISHTKSDRWVLKKSQGRPYETSCNIFCNSFKQIDLFKSPKTLTYIQYRLLCVTQATYRAIEVINESWKKYQGRPNETSCNIFCNSFKQIDVYKSSKNIEIYTIQAVMCHTGNASCNKSDQWVLKKGPRTSLWDVLQHIL